MKKSQHWQIGVILVLSAAFLLLLNIAVSNYPVPEQNVDYMTDGWTITRNGEILEDDDLSSCFFSTADRGEVFELTRQFPPRGIQTPTLVFYSIHAAIEVVLDGKVVYSYKPDALTTGEFIGYGFHFVALPSDFANKEVTIRHIVTENNAFTSFEIPMVYNGNRFMQDFVRQNALIFAVIMFLILFGTILFLISVFFAFQNRKFYKLLCVALFSVSIGFWSICSHDLLLLFTDSRILKSTIEYLTLYFIPIPVLLYFVEELQGRSRFFRILYFSAVGIQIAFFLTAVICRITGWIHLPSFLVFQHLILAMAFIGLFFMFESDFRHHKIKHGILIAGLVLMISLGLFDVIIFNLQKYVGIFQKAHFTSNLGLGCLLFVVAQVTDFVVEIHNMLLISAEQAALERMAYTDTLTGLPNRRKCEDVMAALDRDGREHFSIISLDLNYLKRINDSLGHEDGDLLIKTYASVLQESFREVGMSGRMGGDEFIVIVEDVTKVNLSAAVEQYLENLRNADAQQPRFTISAAHGICGRDEDPSYTSAEAYRIADERMYEMKVAMKAQRTD